MLTKNEKVHCVIVMRTITILNLNGSKSDSANKKKSVPSPAFFFRKKYYGT
jgi:hypothetical protein